MTATARAAINRENAQASTGPKSEAGKNRTRMNALAHGLTSKQVVLPHESNEEYQLMHQGLIDSYNPANQNENVLVDRLAQAYWRLQRCYEVERAFLENRIDAAREGTPDIDAGAAMAMLFIDKAESSRMRLVMRYVASAERTYNKAMSDLNKAQSDRRKQEKEQACQEALVRMHTGGPEAAGFVSHTATDDISQPGAEVFESRHNDGAASPGIGYARAA
jgi:hypothetical protein